MADDILGSLAVEIVGDYSDLQPSIDAATGVAEAGAAKIADAFDVPLGDAMVASLGSLVDQINSAGQSADAAGGQMSLFGQDTTTALSDINEQLSLFDTNGIAATDEAFGSLAQSAGDAVGPTQEAAQSITEAGNAGQEAEGGLSSMVEQLTLLGEVLVVTEGLREFGVEALTAYGTVQSVTVGLTALTGSAEKADSIIESIKQLAATEPFAFPEIAPTVQKMVALGVAAEAIPKAIQTIADTSAATTNSFQSVAQRFDQIALSGNATAKSLVGLGIDIGTLGHAMEDAGYQAGNSGKEITAAFKALPDEATRVGILEDALSKFAGTATAEAKTVGGEWQIFKNQFEEVMVGVGKAFAPVIGDILDFGKVVLSGVQTAVEDFEKLSEPVKEAVVVIGLLAAAAVPVAAALTAIGLAAEGLTKLPAILGGISGAMGLTAGSEVALAAANESLATEVTDVTSPLANVAQVVGTVEQSMKKATVAAVETGEAAAVMSRGGIAAAVVAFGEMNVAIVSGVAASLTTFATVTIPAAGAALVSFATGGVATAGASLASTLTIDVAAAEGALVAFGSTIASVAIPALASIAVAVGGAALAFAGWKIGEWAAENIPAIQAVGQAIDQWIIDKVPLGAAAFGHIQDVFGTTYEATKKLEAQLTEMGVAFTKAFPTNEAAAESYLSELYKIRDAQEGAGASAGTHAAQTSKLITTLQSAETALSEAKKTLADIATNHKADADYANEHAAAEANVEKAQKALNAVLGDTAAALKAHKEDLIGVDAAAQKLVDDYKKTSDTWLTVKQAYLDGKATIEQLGIATENADAAAKKYQASIDSATGAVKAHGAAAKLAADSVNAIHDAQVKADAELTNAITVYNTVRQASIDAGGSTSEWTRAENDLIAAFKAANPAAVGTAESATQFQKAALDAAAAARGLGDVLTTIIENGKKVTVPLADVKTAIDDVGKSAKNAWDYGNEFSDIIITLGDDSAAATTKLDDFNVGFGKVIVTIDDGHGPYLTAIDDTNNLGAAALTTADGIIQLKGATDAAKQSTDNLSQSWVFTDGVWVTALDLIKQVNSELDNQATAAKKAADALDSEAAAWDAVDAASSKATSGKGGGSQSGAPGTNSPFYLGNNPTAMHDLGSLFGPFAPTQTFDPYETGNAPGQGGNVGGSGGVGLLRAVVQMPTQGGGLDTGGISSSPGPRSVQAVDFVKEFVTALTNPNYVAPSAATGAAGGSSGVPLLTDPAAIAQAKTQIADLEAQIKLLGSSAGDNADLISIAQSAIDTLNRELGTAGSSSGLTPSITAVGLAAQGSTAAVNTVTQAVASLGDPTITTSVTTTAAAVKDFAVGTAGQFGTVVNSLGDQLTKFGTVVSSTGQILAGALTTLTNLNVIASSTPGGTPIAADPNTGVAGSPQYTLVGGKWVQTGTFQGFTNTLLTPQGTPSYTPPSPTTGLPSSQIGNQSGATLNVAVNFGGATIYGQAGADGVANALTNALRTNAGLKLFG